MKPRKRKCKIREPGCEIEYLPFNSLQKCCPNPKCALRQAQIDAERKERKKARADMDRVKTRSEWLREAQTAFNAWIRERDKDDPCISCGRFHQGQYHAGHYRTVGSHPELRFHPLNCHKQCAPCNNHKSGDIVNYRINLVNKIGEEGLEFLEGPHEPKKYTIEEIKAIKKTYQQALRELKKNNQKWLDTNLISARLDIED